MPQTIHNYQELVQLHDMITVLRLPILTPGKEREWAMAEAKGRVLVVDDDEAVRSSISLTLEAHVIAVIDGELTARPFSAIEQEDADVWGVISGSIRDFR